MDKQSKTLIKYLLKNGGCSKTVPFSDLGELANDFNMKVESLQATVRYLNEIGYIDYQKFYKSNKNASFSLSHRGENWKYFRRKEILDYMADKWIDFFAFIISAISLAISLIALLSK